MTYPNVKPPQGEQQDINQRRYPADNIELAGPQTQPPPGDSTPARTHSTAGIPWSTNRPPSRP